MLWPYNRSMLLVACCTSPRNRDQASKRLPFKAANPSNTKRSTTPYTALLACATFAASTAAK
eukprot:10072978-Alexandrium_andersonii.AAC.1